MKVRVVLLLFFLLTFLSCNALRPPRMVPRAVYTVQHGDTLSSVSERYEVPLKELYALNSLNEDSVILPGEKIFLPPDYLSGPKIQTSSKVKKEVLGGATKYVGQLSWPLRYSRTEKRQASINSQFGRRWSSFHEGVDLAGKIGTPIFAAHDGKVVYSGEGMDGYGKMVVIQGDGFLTAYAHNRKNLVRLGAPVQRGQQIAELGMTGKVTGPHLHFETRIKNATGKYVAVNPLLFFSEG